MSTRMNVATIGSPEFLNISSINPNISKCEIKVLYIGENRNRSLITKEVATQMAATLPGTPIVGHYIESKDDFGGHDQEIIIDSEGVKFKTLTTPYGFVAPDAKIWFQKFEDIDDFGNTIVHEYLMTEGYLWTGQFEECKRVLQSGNPQSMELDENSLKGYWSEDVNRGVEFFIINDAIFSKLCILGEDVAPCFEGASVVGTQFSKDEGFNKTLYTMMQELNDALKGEAKMENENLVVAEEASEEKISEFSQDNVVEENIAEIEETIEEANSEIVEESPVSEEPAVEPEVEFTAETEEVVSEPVVEEEIPAAAEEAPAQEFAKEDEEKKEEDEKSDSEEKPAEDTKEEDEDEKKKYALLEEKYAELETRYAALEAEYQKAVEIKNKFEEQQKDALITSFSMLDEADKQEVINNKSQYSLEEIESKLSVIYSRKQRAMFTVATEEKTEEVEAPVIYSVESDLSNSNPDWVNMVLTTQKSL